MVVNDICISVKNCFCIKNKFGKLEVLQYSPFTGNELYGSFIHELQLIVAEKLLGKNNLGCEFSEQWYRNEKENYPIIDVNLIPSHLKHLIQDRNWYEKVIKAKRESHHDGEFCYDLEGFVFSCYGEYDPLPKLACVPIQYCPFCGVKLPPEFDQENWWEKEFKTFKWYKDHKMGEWADDYVDDCDWTEDDYPPTSNDKNSQ